MTLGTLYNSLVFSISGYYIILVHAGSKALEIIMFLATNVRNKLSTEAAVGVTDALQTLLKITVTRTPKCKVSPFIVVFI